MEKGIVKFYNTEKNFGFIIPESGSDDIFVHQSGVSEQTGQLKEGDHVEYNTEQGKKGLNATDVKRI